MGTPRAWQHRGLLARALWPLSMLYRALTALHRAVYRWGWRPIYRAPVPVVVVGNWITGGAGKTPTLLLLVALIQAWGWRVGIVSRGYGRTDAAVRVASPGDSAQALGDEPLLIHRRTGAPLAVGADRSAATRALLAAHPDLQLILSDDGLQHHALARDLTLSVFDARGLGNGWLLPAGPLRQDRSHPPLAGSRATELVLYTDGVASTARSGHVAKRRLVLAWPLADWWQGQAHNAVPLSALQGRPLLACAGLAQPERFFHLLEAAGLHITPLPQPDHAPLDPLPWPAHTADVLVTEKDAVKLQPARIPSGQRVWVLPLDLQAPPAFAAALLNELTALLGPPPHPNAHGSPPD